MSQIQIKEIINSFCKIIQSFDFSPLTAEDFRLAKFNKSNVAEKMWRLLFELVYFGKTDSINRNFNCNNSNEIINELKKEMLKLGYLCEEFLNLDNSLTNSSSREILLSIGWFISTQEPINLFIAKLNTFLDDEYFKEAAIQRLKELDNNEETKLIKQFENINKTDLLEQLNYLRRVETQFKHKLNSLYSALIEKSKLTYQIHKDTKNNGPKHNGNLSCLEVYLIKNPNKIENYEKLYEKKLELLNSILFWLENEGFFWEWMESVVDEKLEEKNGKEETDLTDESKLNELNEFVLSDLSEEQIKNILKSEVSLDVCLKSLNVYLNKKKQDIGVDSCENDLNRLVKENKSLLNSYQEKLEDDLKNLLISTNLNEISLTSSNQNEISLLNERLVEPRLSLDMVKQSNESTKPKNNKSNNSNFISNVDYELNQYENRINFLKAIYQENKTSLSENCEKLISQLDKCYAIYSK